LLIIGLCIVLG